MKYTMVIHKQCQEKGNVVDTVIPVLCGQTLLTAIQSGGHSEINAPCGGVGTCKKCAVLCKGKFKDYEYKENAEWLLSCRTIIDGDCEVWIDERPEHSVLLQKSQNGDVVNNTSNHNYSELGVAVDIGTTTIAVYLFDLHSGKLVDSIGEANNQRIFGADVISRINCVGDGDGLNLMSDTIRTQLNGLIEDLCKKNACDQKLIHKISVAANTVMSHIFAGISPVSIGVAPYTPLSLFDIEIKAGDVCITAATDAVVYILPAISGYVGGDIVGGLLASGAYKSEQPCMFIDIGTNGEMALGGKDGFLCCATAAGPAFEGAQISCGMSAVAGAINKVSVLDGKVHCKTIGNAPACGVCGSGLVDAVAAMLATGEVDETGRILDGDSFHLCDNVVITGYDIRQVQLAKAAIAAGVETLLHHAGLNCDDISTVYLAGGFGNFLDTKSVVAIGMLPQKLAAKIVPVGNTAGESAGMALLSNDAIQSLREIKEKCSYIELSGNQYFFNAYIDAMEFI